MVLREWLLLPSLNSLLHHGTLFFSFMARLTLGNNVSIHLFSGPSCHLLCALPPSLFYLSLCIQGQGLAHSRCLIHIFMETNKVGGYL